MKVRVNSHPVCRHSIHPAHSGDSRLLIPAVKSQYLGEFLIARGSRISVLLDD